MAKLLPRPLGQNLVASWIKFFARGPDYSTLCPSAQSFKVMKKTPAEPIDGQPVVDIEFKYDLLTQGGLAVGRHGFSRCIQVCSWGFGIQSVGSCSRQARLEPREASRYVVIPANHSHDEAGIFGFRRHVSACALVVAYSLAPLVDFLGFCLCNAAPMVTFLELQTLTNAITL